MLAPDVGVVPARLRRVALLSVHTSPLDRPGVGDGGGLNVYVREVAARLAVRGVEVDIFTRRSSPRGPDTRTLADGVAVHQIPAGPAAPVDKQTVTNHLCAFLLALQRHPLAGTHDLVHAHYWLSGWVGRRVAPRWGVPFVQTFHTLAAMKNASLAPGDVAEPPLRLLAESQVARDADRLLVLTAAEARLLQRSYGLPRERSTVVPAGVDLARFRPPTEPRTPAGDAPRLLFVGRLQPLKGPDIAVRTLAAVRRQLPGATLRIVGGTSGSGRGRTGPDELRALAKSLGVAHAVRLEDAVPQEALLERYHDADVLLAPSRSETFGLVALEAQASGTPVVAADVPGLRSVVGDGGSLVAGHDPADHAEAVVAMLSDPVRTARARAAAIERARTSSWEDTAERTLAAYRDVLASRRAAMVVRSA